MCNSTVHSPSHSEGEATAISNQSCSFPESPAFLAAGADAGIERWFALQTRARHEKVVAQRLSDKGVTSFLPLVRQEHRWSDRRKTVEVPLFSCYLFVKLAPCNNEHLRVLTVDGGLKFVGNQGLGTPIPDDQIDTIRTLVE